MREKININFVDYLNNDLLMILAHALKRVNIIYFLSIDIFFIQKNVRRSKIGNQNRLNNRF